MATRTRKTPLLTSKGIFEVSTPFVINKKKVYEVVAIRELEDLWAQHVDVYEEYYKPVNISFDDYKADVQVKVAIVSLLGEEGVLYIPDTYILHYPEEALANYQHVVLSVSLGALHKSQDLRAVMNDISQRVSGLIGVTPKVNIHVAPTTEALTLKDAASIEQIRKGNINTPESDYLKFSEQMRKNEQMVKAANQRISKSVGKGDLFRSR